METRLSKPRVAKALFSTDDGDRICAKDQRENRFQSKLQTPISEPMAIPIPEVPWGHELMVQPRWAQ